MTEKKQLKNWITSDLATATLTGNEEIHVVQSGASKKTTASAIIGKHTTDTAHFSGSYNDLTDKPTIHSGTVKSVNSNAPDGNGNVTITIPAQASDISAESSLGNPTVDGHVLSSTTTGVRSWIAPATGGGGGATTLDGLTDVTITDVATGELLVKADSGWENKTKAEAGVEPSLGNPAVSGHFLTSTDEGFRSWANPLVRNKVNVSTDDVSPILIFGSDSDYVSYLNIPSLSVQLTGNGTQTVHINVNSIPFGETATIVSDSEIPKRIRAYQPPGGDPQYLNNSTDEILLSPFSVIQITQSNGRGYIVSSTDGSLPNNSYTRENKEIQENDYYTGILYPWVSYDPDGFLIYPVTQQDTNYVLNARGRIRFVIPEIIYGCANFQILNSTNENLRIEIAGATTHISSINGRRLSNELRFVEIPSYGNSRDEIQLITLTAGSTNNGGPLGRAVLRYNLSYQLPLDNFDANSETKLGNDDSLIRQSLGLVPHNTFGDATNNTTFEADGTLKMNGTAKVWKDLIIAPSALGAAQSAPDLINFDASGLKIHSFDGGTTMEQLYGSFELQHDYAEGTALDVHVHWTPTTADAGDVKWQFEYKLANMGAAFPPDWVTISSVNATPSAAWQHIYNDIGDIPGAGVKMGAIVLFRLFRDPTDAADTYPADAGLLSIGVHYQCDTLGSREELTK